MATTEKLSRGNELRGDERDGDERDETSEKAGDIGKEGDEEKPIPGPGAPLKPEPATPDANPIDPRVFAIINMAW